MRLNNEAYSAEKDHLIYDRSHPSDASNVMVTVPADTDGMLVRGEVLDFQEGTYVPHVQNGTASVIVAENTPYEAEDTEVTATVYISGCFRKSECTAAVELTVSDEEALRSKGIYLK